MFLRSQLIQWTSFALWFSQAKWMSAITRFIETDNSEVDMNYGMLLLGGLLVNLMLEHYLDEHTFSSNIQTGFAYQ